uniref:Thioredoxin domain-containing protein n=1 Tax=Aureoumbra lagunensis TaxID=44058 RepID=A0A7S3K7C6_9STRA
MRLVFLFVFLRGVLGLENRSIEADCFDFPKRSFSTTNCVKCTYGASPHIPVSVGDNISPQLQALTLSTASGSSWKSLGTETSGKISVLIWGMWTCPAFQGLGTGGSPPFDECSYRDEYDLVETYANKGVRFIHLIGPEPHPITPDVNFDSGKQLMNYWSTIAQPKTWDDRLQVAQRTAALIHPRSLTLVDPLADAPTQHKEGTEGFKNQPTWCTLGLGARTAILIDQHGTVQFTQDWFRKSDLANALDTLLK